MLNYIKRLFKKEKIPKVEFRPKGRSGTLVYVEETQECEMYFEISGISEYDILAFTETITKWSNGKSVSDSEKQIILSAFKNWAAVKKYRVQW